MWSWIDSEISLKAENLPWTHPTPDADDSYSRSFAAQIRKLDGTDAREVMFVYIYSDPIVLYRSLFVAQQKAPLFLCLKKPDQLPPGALRSMKYLVPPQSQLKPSDVPNTNKHAPMMSA
jgi:hypothetical protein